LKGWTRYTVILIHFMRSRLLFSYFFPGHFNLFKVRGFYTPPSYPD
jgi:hypothetical protein